MMDRSMTAESNSDGFGSGEQGRDRGGMEMNSCQQKVNATGQKQGREQSVHNCYSGPAWREISEIPDRFNSSSTR